MRGEERGGGRPPSLVLLSTDSKLDSTELQAELSAELAFLSLKLAVRRGAGAPRPMRREGAPRLTAPSVRGASTLPLLPSLSSHRTLCGVLSPLLGAPSSHLILHPILPSAPPPSTLQGLPGLPRASWCRWEPECRVSTPPGWGEDRPGWR